MSRLEEFKTMKNVESIAKNKLDVAKNYLDVLKRVQESIENDFRGEAVKSPEFVQRLAKIYEYYANAEAECENMDKQCHQVSIFMGLSEYCICRTEDDKFFEQYRDELANAYSKEQESLVNIETILADAKKLIASSKYESLFNILIAKENVKSLEPTPGEEE